MGTNTVLYRSLNSVLHGLPSAVFPDVAVLAYVQYASQRVSVGSLGTRNNNTYKQQLQVKMKTSNKKIGESNSVLLAFDSAGLVRRVECLDFFHNS